jgi:glycosyltransferase involved in cell wall biosynthesis
MRVLHVIPSVSERSGGPGLAIVPMCRALQEQGTEVLVATTDEGLNGDQISMGTPTNYKGIRAIFFPAQLGNSFKYSRPLTVWLNANVRDFALVHIHAVFNHASIAAARACRKQGVPYIVRPLGTLDPWSMKQKSLRKSMYWHLAGRRMLVDAAAVHYTSLAEQEATEQSLGLAHGTVVPLGFNVEFDDTHFEQNHFANEFPVLAKNRYVLVLSRLLPTKGLDALLDAFLPLVKQAEFSSWRLVFAGEGPEEYVGALRRKVATQGLENSVLFPGWLDGERKNTFLRQASLLALPSYHENFGLCVMEALAFGVPVLVSPHVHLAEDILSAGGGWLANVEKESIEVTLKEVFRSDAERARRGLAGKEFSRRFTWRNIAGQLIDVYSQLLAERAQQQSQVIVHA